MPATKTAWKAYAAARGDNAPNAATDALADAALVRAVDHIQYAYVARMIRPAPDALIENATYEIATLELATPGLFSKVFTPGDRKVLTEVKGIKWTPVNSTDSADAFANATPTSTKVAAMLAPYMPGKVSVGLASIG